MGEFKSAYDKGAAAKADAGAKEQRVKQEHEDRRQRAFADNERWIEQQLLPVLTEAKRDLQGTLPLVWTSIQSDVRGVKVTFADYPSDKGNADFAVHVDMAGAISTVAGGSAKMPAGTIDSDQAIAAVKRALLNLISERAGK